jgi:hypothetical protein
LIHSFHSECLYRKSRSGHCILRTWRLGCCVHLLCTSGTCNPPSFRV